MNHQLRLEWSAALKRRLFSTRKRDPYSRSTPHPGLFQTVNPSGDLVGLVLALALECYGLTNLWRVGELVLGGALSLVVVDILGALLAHYRMGNLAVIRCRLAITDDPDDRARVKHEDRLRDRAVRALGILMIAASAAWKCTVFTVVGGENGTPTAIVMLMALVYLLAAWLHWQNTGYAIAYLWLRLGQVMERRRFLNEDPATAPGGIHGLRTFRFKSRLPLVELTVGGHRLIAEGDGYYAFVTAGLMVDEELDTFVAAQTCPEARDALSKEGLRAQLAMRDQEPLRPNKASFPVAEAKGNNHASEVAFANGDKPASASTSRIRQTAAMLAATAVAVGFSACGNPPQHKTVVEMEIVIPQEALTDGKKLPVDLIDAIIPKVTEQLPKDGKSSDIVPTISISAVGTANYEPATIEETSDPGFVAKFYGADSSPGKQRANVRKQLEVLELKPNADNQSASKTGATGAKRAKEHIVGGSKDDSASAVFVLQPGATDLQPAKIGKTEAKKFADPLALSEGISHAVGAGAKKVKLMYVMANALADNSPKKPESENAADSRPRVEERQLEAKQLSPRLQPQTTLLNGAFTHADLVEGAQLDLVVFFESGNSQLTFESIKAIEHLAKNAGAMKTKMGHYVVVGYADESGSQTGNDGLSLDRAVRVAKELKSLGLDVAIAAGAGSTRPVATNATVQGRGSNRRAAIYYTSKPLTAGN